MVENGVVLGKFEEEFRDLIDKNDIRHVQRNYSELIESRATNKWSILLTRCNLIKFKIPENE